MKGIGADKIKTYVINQKKKKKNRKSYASGLMLSNSNLRLSNPISPGKLEGRLNIQIPDSPMPQGYSNFSNQSSLKVIQKPGDGLSDSFVRFSSDCLPANSCIGNI